MAKIKLKNSTTGGSVPSGLSAGELAVNLTDKKLFIGTSDVSGGIFPFLPGVSSIAAGSGISLSNGKTQGDVTIINAGVTSIFGLTGIVGLTGSNGITLSVSGRTLTIQGPGAGSGFTYYNGITAFSFGFQLKGTQLISTDTAKFYLSNNGLDYFVNLTKIAANNNNTDTTTTNLQSMLENSSVSPILHCVNERTKRVLVIEPINSSTPFTISQTTQQLSLVHKTFAGQSLSDFQVSGTGVAGDWITIHFTLIPVTGFAFLGNGGLSATSTTPTILTDGDGVTHSVSYKEIFIDPTNIADMAGASTIDEAEDGFLFYDINATGNKLRKATFKKAVLDSADTLFTTRTSSQLLKDKSSTSVIYDIIAASTISGAENGLLTGATAYKYLEANTVKSFNGNTGHVSINIVNTLNGRTGDLQGVTAIVAGSGISVSGPTGEVTVTNAGVLSFNNNTGAVQGVSAAVAGSGISVSGATGSVTIANTGVLSINGSAGAITNVARLNEGNTFSVRQVMNSGITTSNLYVSTGTTFAKNVDMISTTAMMQGYNTAGYLKLQSTGTLFTVPGSPSIILQDADIDLAGVPNITINSSPDNGGGAITIGNPSSATTIDGTVGLGRTSTTTTIVGTSTLTGRSTHTGGITTANLYVSTGSTFNSSINLVGSLLVNGSNGTSNQVLTSTGSGITWSTPSSGVTSVNGLTGAVKIGRSISVYAPTTTDNITMFYTSNALTVTNIESVLRGSGTGVTFSVLYGLDRSSGGTAIVTSGINCTNTTTGLSTTSFNNSTIVAGSFVWLTVSGVSGNPNELSVTMEF